VNALVAFYDAGQALGLHEHTAVAAWLQRCMERPASKVRC
jgi:glutathione S-transferase